MSYDMLENNNEIITPVNDEGTNYYTSNTHEKSKNNFEYIKKIESELVQLKRIIKQQSEEIHDLNTALDKTSFQSADQIKQSTPNSQFSNKDMFNIMTNKSYYIITN